MGGTFALLLAAGTGRRLGREPKGFVELGGVPLFLHSLRAIADCPGIDGVVVLVPEGLVERAGATSAPFGRTLRVDVRIGGATRVDSVKAGLEALPSDAQVVVCHDAARPFASSDLFRRALTGLSGFDGVVPVVSSPDTVKRLRAGRVVETLPRGELGLVQTPQAFVAEVLIDAHRRLGADDAHVTDDAMMLEATGYRVGTVEGEPGNFKITTQEDLRRAELLLSSDAPSVAAARERSR